MVASTSPAATSFLAAGDPDAVALLGQDVATTYADLRRAVVDRACELDLGTRSVVVLSGPNCHEWVVTYLALLEAGHVPLLASGDPERLVSTWRPTARIDVDRTGWRIERSDGAPPQLHPDLALLMSTSGSTGSPKLVRLSTENLLANATAIAAFQHLTPADRGITGLPLHYSFGLSVLHSHLVAGAGVVVTDLSVVDRCFGDALRDHAVTNFAGVPHSYELLDQVGPDRLRVPTLRFLAHAGGRMAPDRVRAWAARAHSWGAEWFTMYGQTEATARMAYVPPGVVRSRPGAIGIAIPGGELTVDPHDPAEPDVGELVYRGPNVMLGYATAPADLALGRVVTELRTGDLGRHDPESGLFEIVGRTARRVKPFGLRIDLDDVEHRLADRGMAAVVAGDDDGLVASAPGHRVADVVAALGAATGLPATALAATDAAAPRTPSGKVDSVALLALARGAQVAANEDATPDVTPDVMSRIRAAYATVLGQPDVRPHDTFVGLGGDSLSYVECSIRLERILGPLPADWHTRTVDELATLAAPRRLARLDTTVLLRTVGICMVVATHMRLGHVPGGAHLLLAVVGYNLARFMTPIDDAAERFRAGARTVARVALPTMAWAGTGLALGAGYGVGTLLLVNNYVGPRSHADDHWHFWFIEVFTHLVLLTTLLLAIRPVRRAERRWPYAFPLVLLAGTLALRLDWADLGDWYNMRFRTHSVAWFFVLGWVVQRSVTVRQKVLTTVLCLATAPGVFENLGRELRIAGGLVLLLWVPQLPVPRFAVRPIATLAAASMWILISHFTLWPPLEERLPLGVAYVATLAASTGVWWLADRAVPSLWRRWRTAGWSRQLATRGPRFAES